MDAYFRPSDLPEALDLMARHRPQPLAGGTDLYPALTGAEVWGPRPALNWLDLSGIAALRGVSASRIGALATWSEVAEAALPPAFRALQQAARQVAGRQVQNRGTVLGNLCNASPAADGVPPLLLLEPEVELVSAAGSRRIPLAQFILHNRRTARAPDEIAVALHVADVPDAPSRFEKLGARRQLVISIAMAAGLLRWDGARIAQAPATGDNIAQLTAEGEALCAAGQSRRGIAKLRRALRMALTEG
jgi:CO/xanthine dehydrogenase FAD-binding subunit